MSEAYQMEAEPEYERVDSLTYSVLRRQDIGFRHGAYITSVALGEG